MMVCPAGYGAVSKHMNAFTEGERLVYTRVLEAYRKGSLPETARQRDILQKNYPKSVHLDNAHYLTGVLYFQNNRFADALREFGVVVDQYPTANKRSAALFAKAMTYDKLGLKDLSRQLLHRTIKEYPGSEESQRAWMQLKLAGAKASKNVKR